MNFPIPTVTADELRRALDDRGAYKGTERDYVNAIRQSGMAEFVTRLTAASLLVGGITPRECALTAFALGIQFGLTTAANREKELPRA